MRRDLFKLLIVVGAILFAILFGMELASSGIQSVYGPVDSSGATLNGYEEERTVSGGASRPISTNGEDDPEDARYGNEPQGISYDPEDSVEAEEEEAVLPRADRAPMVDRLAGKTAEALQSASKGGIHFIVNLFNKTTE